MMNQKKQNIRLLVILGLLVICSVILGLTRENRKSTFENKYAFALQDTSRVDQISINSNKGDIILKKTNGTWMLNDHFKAEPNMVKILLSILKDSEAVRNVPKSQKETIAEYVKNNGQLVSIFSEGKNINSFYVAGNNNKTVSYMMSVDGNSPMVVNIPGYESYVAGIFEIPVNDWRDRVILSTNWRTLQKLNLHYSQYPNYDLNIKFDFNFLNIDGVNELDTARMMAFIDEFNSLQADRYIDKNQIPKYDSLIQTPSTVTLTIEDINADNSKTIDFFPPLPNDPMMPAYVREDDQIVLFEAGRIQKLFAVKDDFEAKNQQSIPNP
jgi:archaellum component FlaG (FlaF/FlaG flagellin family)